MRGRHLLTGLFVFLAIFAVVATACSDNKKDNGNGAVPTATVSDGPSTETDVAVNLTEYTVAPDPAIAPAGDITFTASNIGGTDHELLVIKTDLAPAELPTADDGSVDEAGDGIEVIDKIAEFAAQGEESLTLSLDAGTYVLICNIVQTKADGSLVSHYAEGMAAAFQVTE